ncbi:hypothetical protein HF521_008436 [Silurus meridionalis]|uniref:Dynein heavy chain linker domain-containing protein n=1 Tax=Silurus meridionalis TaxID=175797 RepID=A0A8T0AMK1_SILME|nr:hypothetical protein HF521_008436 [Silurus meridionalis]
MDDLKPDPELPAAMSEARKQHMNYLLLRQCVESRPIVPIQQQWIDNMMFLVPPQLRAGPGKVELVEELCNEVGEDFCSTMLKFTFDNILQKSQECTDVLLPTPAKKPWHGTFTRSRKVIEENLHILHPAMKIVLEICHVTFSQMLLIDLSGCRSIGPVDCEQLKNKVSVECQRVEQKLMKTWFPRIIQLLTSKSTIQRIKEEKLDAFYNCVATLLSNQLKALIKRSMEAFVSLFGPLNKQELPLFTMALIFDDEKMAFSPSFQELEEAVLDILNSIIHTLQKVPTVQSWIDEENRSVVDAKVPENIITWAETTVRNAVHENLQAPMKHFQNYSENYDWLINGSAQDQVEKFMEEQHSFEQYTEQVESFRALSKELSNLDSVAHFDMICLKCDELNQGLSNKAHTFSTILVERLISANREHCLQICEEFEIIKEKSLKTPTTSEEMTEMIEYIEQVKTIGLEELGIKIKEVHNRLNYLLDVHIFDVEDLKLHSTVLMWPQNILPIFDQSAEILEKAKQKGQQELLGRREKLLLELDKLAKRIEEFIHCFDLDMMHQYVKDVKKVVKRVQDADEAIVFINKEETLYNWDLTDYPEIDVIKENLEPYNKLFGLVLRWQTTQEKWMNGPFLDLNGERIEAEVDEFSQEIYKSLKFFQQKQKKAEQEKAAAKKPGEEEEEEEEEKQVEEKQESPNAAICNKVITQISQFKENIPTVSILCNPGMRARHWEQMSAIMNYDMSPSPETTLSNVLKKNFTAYLEQLETISTAASKEFSLEKAMQTMLESWDVVAFNYVAYRESGVSIVTAVDEIQTMLDDQIVKTQTMRSSPFIKPFEVEIRAWEDRLINIQDTIDEWLKVQAQWLYLEPIFSSQDIMQQMPEEGRQFQIVDKHWREVMKHCEKDSKRKNSIKIVG